MSDLPAHYKRQQKTDDAQADEELPNANLLSLLPDDVLDKCFSFLGPGHYRYVGGVCKRFRHVYLHERSNRTKVTFWRLVTATVPCAELCLDDQERLGRTSAEKKDAIATIGSKAIEYGKVEVLEWAHGKGIILNIAMFWTAAGNGHVNVLEWANSNNFEWCSLELGEAAVINGHVNVLDFILDKHPSAFDYYADVSYLACSYGRIDVLEWLEQKQLLPDKDNGKYCMNAAAREGRVSALDWLCEKGYQPPFNIANSAASGGHIDVLQWAQDRGIHGSNDACAYAALRGHLNMLQWLRENDCPWDSRVIFFATERGHDHVVDWARENGCPEPEPEEEEDDDLF